MNIPMLDLVNQYNQIKSEIDSAIQEVLTSGAFIMGPQVRQFEENMEQFLGVKHAIGVASGSDALVLSLHALDIGPSDKVIVPTFTFFATAGAVTRVGAAPVFADIDPDTYNLNLNMVEELLQKDSSIKAIIPVHLFGLPVDMARLIFLAEEYDVKIIEDACQAINADIYLDGNGCSLPLTPSSSPQKAGTIGHTGCFSFFPSKNLGGCGDGGMVVTNDDDLAERVRILRVHGSKPKYHHHVVGYNSRLDTIQATILNVKLKYLNQWTEKRRKVAALYNEAFQAAGLALCRAAETGDSDHDGQSLQSSSSGSRESSGIIKIPEIVDGHVFHQYVIEVDHRDGLAAQLRDKGIGNSIYYPIPLHLQHCYQHFGYQPGDLPVAEQACRRVLALPIDPELTEEEIKYIAGSINDFVNHL